MAIDKNKITVVDEKADTSAQGKVTEVAEGRNLSGKVTAVTNTESVPEGRQSAITEADAPKAKGKVTDVESEKNIGKITAADRETDAWLKQGDWVKFGNNLLPQEPQRPKLIAGPYMIIGPNENPTVLCRKFPEGQGVALLRDRRTGRPVSYAPTGDDPLHYDFLVYERCGDAYAWFKVQSTQVLVLSAE